MRGDHKPGERCGDWTLTEYVDTGGNGDVWIAEDSTGRTCAVKILHRFGGDGYSRFAREVEVVRGLDTNRYAVLPILDAHIPETPSRRTLPGS